MSESFCPIESIVLYPMVPEAAANEEQEQEDKIVSNNIILEKTEPDHYMTLWDEEVALALDMDEDPWA